MTHARTLLAVLTCAVLVGLAEGATAAAKKLTREELVALFAALNGAAKTARTFQADLRRSEQSGFVIDEEPLVSEGTVSIERPERFRQEIVRPRRSLTVVNSKDLWIYFPDAREVQHVDLTKGVKGKAGTSAESIMPWLTFDLAGLEKTFKVEAWLEDPPEWATLKLVPEDRRGKIAAAEVKDLPARALERCFRIEFAPVKQELAPAMATLSLWVDGVNPWPVKIGQENPDGDVVTTEYRNIVLEAPIDAREFEFRPPRRTKVQELSG